jgi:hypothetical protein
MATTYEKIASNTLSSASATITFSSISSAYTDLRIVLSGLRNPNGGTQLYVRFNSDSNTNYSFTDLIGDGTAASSSRTTSATSLLMHYDGFNTLTPTFVPIDIFSYAGSTYKTCLFQWNSDKSGYGYIKYSVGLWRSTSAITSITLSSEDLLAPGTTATLYGIKAA